MGDRHISGASLETALRQSRARTWELVDDLSPAQWQPPLQPGVNPIAWELAHLAWFAEFWTQRGPHSRHADGHATAHWPPRHAGPDATFDSSRLAHAARWSTPMPSPTQLRAMLTGQLDATVEALHDLAARGAGDASPRSGDPVQWPPLYFFQLALFHEDMHAEAFCWLRSALGYAPPVGIKLPQVGQREALQVKRGTLQMGHAAHFSGFAFDNEQPARTVPVADFEIDSDPLSALDFARFVDAGGYAQAAFWPGPAGEWRSSCGLTHPGLWRLGKNPGDSAASRWEMRWFDQWLPLTPGLPAMHLNAFEAEAYCRWAKRRLPTAAEWEFAAASDPAFAWGHSVWEWTADPFAPYAGFSPGPYREYSEPWFGNHRELRGGAFATHERLHHPKYRNFFQPHRSDIFVGFRTVAE